MAKQLVEVVETQPWSSSLTKNAALVVGAPGGDEQFSSRRSPLLGAALARGCLGLPSSETTGI